MKRFLSMLLVLAMLIVPVVGMSAESVTQVWSKPEQRSALVILTATWVTDGAGALTAVAVTGTANKYGYFLYAITDPGATTPDANYDVSIKDANGVDIFGQALYNRSDTATEVAEPAIRWFYWDGEALTFDILDNTAAAGNGVVKFYLLMSE